MSVMLRVGGTQVGDDGIPRGGVVPYEDLADSLMGHDGILEKVHLAIRTLNGDTRLRVLFKKKSPTDTQWIRFETKSPWPHSNCPAYAQEVGKHRLNAERGETEYVQHVYISDWATVGHVMHQLMHVLGFVHGHQRDDRDNYVIINDKVKANVNYRGNAFSVPPNAPYDIESIMHYPNCHSIKIKPDYINWLKREMYPGKTEEEINGLVGQRTRLSDGDVKAIGWVYGDRGCTYAAFLDNPCEHKHYLCETCDKPICLYCQETCDEHKDHKVKLVEDHIGGFLCECSERDNHAAQYTTQAYEFEKLHN